MFLLHSSGTVAFAPGEVVIQLSLVRVVALALAAAMLSACGTLGEIGGPSEQELSNALDSAARAAARADELEVRIARLESRFASERRERAAVERRLERGLERRSERFTEAVAKLRKSLDEVREAGRSLEADAANALSEARDAARALAVLTRRFDYHLRSHDRG